MKFYAGSLLRLARKNSRYSIQFNSNLLSKVSRKIRRGLQNRFFFYRSYSTYFEDLILTKVLPEPEGTYLDIGSGHPFRGSNTYLFYARGWKGILIDPIKKNEIDSKSKRPKDLFIRNLVSNSKNPLKFFEFADYQISNTSVEVTEKLAKRGIVPSTTETFTPILVSELNFFVTPSEPALLNIDVEGHELAVLQSVDWKRQAPRVISVEDWSYLEGKPDEISEYLIKLGYFLFSKTVITNIFVHNSYLPELRKRILLHSDQN